MTAEAKIRLLARQDSTLQSFFFTGGQVRWFDEQLKPGYIKSGTCATVTLVSTVREYCHETATRQSACAQAQPRLQIDVWDYDPERARDAAAAIRDWLSTVDFSSNDQFASPPSSPRRHPNFVLDERGGMVPETQPPVYRRRLEVRIFNLEE